MNNLHELTKQLDVLTWNSRSVLNALIRSAMAAGSSDGFTVKRAGEDVKLTRQDIYKLYHFYEAWEATQFDEDSFDEIRANMNEEYAGTGGVDAALINHAKIMWMDADNATSTADQWIEKIKQYTNPKWLTNTAPIPINIRTPIYDENLSTKTYDSYETYLFPSAYYAIDTLGHSGDGFDHNAGGHTWHFNIDDVFTVEANRVLLGTQDAGRLAAYQNLYGTAPVHSLEGGDNSFAFGKNTLSYGQKNLAYRDNSAIVGGFSNLVTGSQSVITGGNSNIIASANSAIGAGLNNMIGTGTESFAANTLNSIGGYAYYFKRTLTSTNNTQTDCQDVIPVGNCGEYQKIDTTTASTTAGGMALSSNQIYIPDDSAAGFGYNRISAGDGTAAYSPVDFKVGDYVTLFGFVTNDGYGNRPCPSLVTQVVAIQSWTSSGVRDLGTGGGQGYGYIITLGDNLNTSKIVGLGNYAIQGGYVVRTYASNYPKITQYGVQYDTDNIYSDNCAAFGYNNIACGASQFVVGSSNEELIAPRFIVGSGSSYITDSNYHRHNSFVSAPNYTYMKTSHYIVSGVSTLTTAEIHGDGDWYLSTRRYDEEYQKGVEKYAGFFAYSKNAHGIVDDQTRAVLRVFHEKSLLAIGDNGLILREPYVDASTTPTTTGTVWNELYCTKGAIAIHSGSSKTVTNTSTVDDSWELFYNEWVRTSTSPGYDQTVTIWGSDSVGIHGHSLQLHASETGGYIYMNAQNLKIRAYTREALTAQPTDYGIVDYALSDTRADLITDSGHFYCTKTRSNIPTTDPDIGSFMANAKCDGMHILSSSNFVSTDGTYNIYDVAQIVLPGNVTCTRADRETDSIPHPIVMSYAVRKNVNTQTSDGNANSRDLGLSYLYEELAYRSDVVKQAGTLVCNNVGIPPYSTNPGQMSYYKIDNETLVPGVDKVFTYDNVLSSMNAHDDYFHKTNNTVAVTSTSNSNEGKIIRPTSLANAAGRVTDCSATAQGAYEGYYLDGVQINPSMYLEVVDGSNYTRGIAYLAYGHSGLMSDSVSGTQQDYIKDVYHYNLTATGSIENRSLFTSKYSRGTSNTNVTDLKDVWVSVILDKSSSQTMRWVPFMRNLVMSVAGGRLTVEFDLNLYTMKKYYAIPVKQTASGNEISMYDGASSSEIFTLCDNPLSIVLPVDPAVGTVMSTAYNRSTGVACQMHGRAYYTGDHTVYITGVYGNMTPGHAYNRSAAWVYTHSYNIPCVVLNMAGWSGWTPADQWYHCMVEGVVNYGG